MNIPPELNLCLNCFRGPPGGGLPQPRSIHEVQLVATLVAVSNFFRNASKNLIINPGKNESSSGVLRVSD